MASSALESVKQLLGEGNYLIDADEMAPFTTPWRGEKRGNASLVAFPDSIETVSKLVALCASHNLAMIPQGGNTGLVYGTLANGEIIINLSRMNQVRDVNLVDRTITVEAGCLLQSVQEEAEKHNTLFPLSMASEGSAEIGGVIATNAGGTAVIKYGNMRDLVLGLEVVMPNGEVISKLSALPKDNAGFDLKQLFIGSEGCFGIITAATLKLFPQPKTRTTAMLCCRSPQDASTIYEYLMQSMGETIVAFEMMSERAMKIVEEHIDDHKSPFDESHPYYLLVEAESTLADYPLKTALENELANIFEKGIATDAIIAESGDQAQRLWSIREHVTEAARKSGIGIHYDIAVPSSQIADFLSSADAAIQATYPDVTIIDFGHFGDGNIHYNQYLPKTTASETLEKLRTELDTLIYDRCIALGGTISAEHGVGLDRQEPFYAYTTPHAIEVMRKLKATFDPQNLMNPGKVIRIDD